MDGGFDETERTIITECLENTFNSKSEIEINLIGEWELIGSANPWEPTNSKPRGLIKFTNEEMIFEFRNMYFDIWSNDEWEIEELNID